MEYAEPMTLGSPVGNPGHYSPPHQTPHGSQYLPGFLMGDLNASTTAPSLNRSRSMLTGSQSQYSSPVTGMSGMTPRSPPSQKKLPLSHMQSSYLSTPVAGKEKVGAPPVQTLMDDVGHPASPHFSMNADVLSKSGLHSNLQNIPPQLHASPSVTRRAELSKSLTPHRAKTPPSPGQTDPFYTQGELITPDLQLDDTWVTVFGFPTSSASFVLQRFSQFGNVLSHHAASDGGNWMHIHYETSLQARKALSRNAKIFPGNIMIGVVPCIEVKVMQANLTSATPRQSTYQTPVQQSRSSRNGTPVRGYKPSSIRPLTAAYQAAASDNKVQNTEGTPQKTSGLLTKAMDYIFG